MLVNVTQARAQNSYTITINGVYITDENCNDLSVIDGVSGTVKYDPETNTLTLENATIETANSCLLIYETAGLNIKVIGENHITSTSSTATGIYCNKTLSITGSGTLYLDGMHALRGENIIIDGCTVNAINTTSKNLFVGIKGKNSTSSTLTVRNANVTIENSDNKWCTMYSIIDFSSLVLEGCALTLPEGAAFDDTLHAVALNGEIVNSKVVIEKITEDTIRYGIKIAGTEITNKNCEDLSVIPGTSGNIRYKAATKTLFLENATIAAEGEIEGVHNDSVSDLIINVTGENNITAYMAAIASAKSATIQGNGTLNANSSNYMGLYIEKDTLTIDNCTVNAIGSWGISGSTAGAALSIKNGAKVTAEGASGSILSLESLTLDESIVIAKPNGAAFDETLKAVALNGGVVTDKIVIEKPVTYGLQILGVDVTNANSDNLSLIPGVSGTAAYDPEAKMLYLENATITGENVWGIYNNTIDSQIINVTGENTITTTDQEAIALRELTIIKGNGTLNAESKNKFCIILYDSCSLEIYDCSVNTKGWNCFKGHQGKESLAIHNANVTADARGSAVSGIKSLTLDGCVITQPVGAIFDEDQQAITINGSTSVEKLTIEKKVSYGLLIAGTEVTNENCEDLSLITGVSGKAKYDPETKTLFLEGATITTDGDKVGIDVRGIDSLNINVTDDNDITSKRDAINSDGIIILKGGGTLNAESSTGAGITCAKLFVIDSCTVNAKGNYGILGRNEISELTIRNATVTAEGGEFGSIIGIGNITFDGTAITQPCGAAFDKTNCAVTLNGEIVTDKVVIEKVENYGLLLAGVNVTDKNCNDLSEIPGVSGTAKYDPETKTLFLEDATIAATGNFFGIINDTIDGLTINVTGENSVTAESPAMNLNYKPTIINGNGTLNIESVAGTGIYFENSLVIDSSTVNVKGNWGIAGKDGTSGNLTIRNANITAMGIEGSICDFQSLTLDGCKISVPADAAFDETLHAVALNGELLNDMVMITYDATVGIKDVKAKVSAHKQGIYSIDGIYLGTDFDALPKGIYIKDGKKVKK